MDRYDVAIPGPGSDDALPITASGDLALHRGLPSMRAWVERAIVCPPGGVPHRPAFGAGAEGAIGASLLVAGQRIGSRVRETVRADRRVRGLRVTTRQDPDTVGRLRVELVVTTVDGQVDALALGV